MNIRFEKIIEQYLLLGVDISNLRNSHYPYYLLKYVIDNSLYIEEIPSNPIDLTTLIAKKQFNKNLKSKDPLAIHACSLICDNIDPAPLFKFELNEDKQRELMNYLRDGLDYTYFKEKEFSSEQLRKIRQGMQSGLDVSVYAKTCFNYDQMHVLYKTLLQRIDPTLIANPIYTRDQMEELRYGLSLDLHVPCYANPKLSVRQMRLIRECLDRSIYTNCLSNPCIPFPILRLIAKHQYKKALKQKTSSEDTNSHA